MVCTPPETSVQIIRLCDFPFVALHQIRRHLSVSDESSDNPWKMQVYLHLYVCAIVLSYNFKTVS